MAQVGKLRYRDGRLIVEGMAGEVLAEVEPDDNMVIDTSGFTAARFLERQAHGAIPADRLVGQISVRWHQRVVEDRGSIDTEAVDAQPRAELEAGDG